MPFAGPGNYVADDYGFARPEYGGPKAVLYGSFAYTDTTAKVLFTIPEGAVIIDFELLVTTLFNDSGTDLVDIGITGTADAFVNDLAVSAAGLTRAGAAGTVLTQLFGTPLTAPVNVIATYTGQNADATAGAATFCLEYILK